MLLKVYCFILKSLNHGKEQRELFIRERKKLTAQESFFSTFKRVREKHKSQDRGYKIGYGAGSGGNMYLTFGSDKTITKDAYDSYRRYSMAMKHYKQEVCDKESFVRGYNEAKEDVTF